MSSVTAPVRANRPPALVAPVVQGDAGQGEDVPAKTRSRSRACPSCRAARRCRTPAPPLMYATREPLAVVSVLPILKTHTEPAFPRPSKVSVPVSCAERREAVDAWGQGEAAQVPAREVDVAGLGREGVVRGDDRVLGRERCRIGGMDRARHDPGGKADDGRAGTDPEIAVDDRGPRVGHRGGPENGEGRRRAQRGAPRPSRRGVPLRPPLAPCVCPGALWRGGPLRSPPAPRGRWVCPGAIWNRSRRSPPPP